jgi:hypothetical protein
MTFLRYLGFALAAGLSSLPAIALLAFGITFLTGDLSIGTFLRSFALTAAITLPSSVIVGLVWLRTRWRLTNWLRNHWLHTNWLHTNLLHTNLLHTKPSSSVWLEGWLWGTLNALLAPTILWLINPLAARLWKVLADLPVLPLTLTGLMLGLASLAIPLGGPIWVGGMRWAMGRLKLVVPPSTVPPA